MLHQYITRQSDGWYLRREYENGARTVHGPYRWEWMAAMMSYCP